MKLTPYNFLVNFFLKPYAFEAREFLRKKLVGKEVCFVRDANAQNVDRGTLYLGKDPANGENIIESIVSAGLAEVRRLNKPRYNIIWLTRYSKFLTYFINSEEEVRLIALEDHAKSQGIGKWCKESDGNSHIRNIKYTIDNPTNFVDSFHQKPLDG